jgi:hypothetical protein
MGNLYEAMASLSPVHDAEMIEGYQRYEEMLAEILTPEQMQAYADEIQKSGVIRIFAKIVSKDLNVSMENRRVVALLNQRGQHAVAPDLGVEHERRMAVPA